MKKIAASLLCLTALPVLAHTGHDELAMGFLAGFTHPLTGLDHLLAMLAVGLWSATTAARRVWPAPLCFAAALLIGALLAQGGLVLPAVEPMAAASVLALGLLIMVRRRFQAAVMAALVAAFALFHGAAHGQELGEPTALAGVVLATVLLHCAGIVAGRAASMRNPSWQRAAGAGIALAGANLVFGLVAG